MRRGKKLIPAAMHWITSAHNATLKGWIKLASQRKVRRQQRQTLLDGIHLIDMALRHHIQLHHCIVADAHQDKAEIKQLLTRINAPITLLPDKLFALLTELASPTGVIAIAAIPNSAPPQQQGSVVVLNGIQDAGNVGSIIRTAAAVGISEVWLDRQCADVWSPKVLRAGMGAHFSLSCIEQLELAAALSAFKGRIVATGLAQPTVSLYEASLKGSIALIVGNEGAGVQHNLLQMVDVCVSIPMQPGVESLNVSAAAAVCLYEWYRQSQLN